MSQPTPPRKSGPSGQQTTPQESSTPQSDKATPPTIGRISRPGSVKIPAPPNYNRSTSQGKAGGSSPSGIGQGGSVRTPGSDGQHSPAINNGPMSPSHSSGAFVFPLRSVFQNKSNQGQGQDGNSGMNRSPSDSRGHDRRQSESITDDAGISSIQQLLERASENRERKKPSGQPGTATFSGKVDRSNSNAGQSDGHSSHAPNTASPAIPLGGAGGSEPVGGFFSMPPNMVDREPSKSPFFEPTTRRQSISNGQIGQSTSRKDKQPERPKIDERSSDGTARADDHAQPTNSSTTASGSGLPDSDRAPVGQPQGPVDEINFRHRPGGDSLEASTSFSTREPKDRTKSPTPSSSSQSKQEKLERSQSRLEHPKPRSVGKEGLPGLGISDGSNNKTDGATFSLDESGERQLITDFSSIVRLGGAGSGGSGMTTTGSGGGTASRGRRSNNGSAQSGGVAGNSKSRGQQRYPHDAAVQEFVRSQATTENMEDPNAATPRQATQNETSKKIDIPDSPPPRPVSEASRPSVSSPRPSGEDTRDSSDTSASGRESSENATASGYDDDDEGADDDFDNQSEEEEPIVTFRFEHSQNTDGHHVVVGREGKLRRCEDEPITTPGAVQGFGVLIVLEDDYETGDLVVRQVSENATELLGLSPKYLFRLSCFTRILTAPQEDLLRDNLEYLPDPQDPETGRQGVAEEGPQVFLLSGYGEPGSEENEDEDEDDTSVSAGARRREWTCWVAAHRPAQPTWNKVDADGNPIEAPDLIVLEFELERDQYNPLTQPFEPRDIPGTPDSASQGTASAGSRGSMSARADSYGSEHNTSGGSTTTVGTTPRPGLSSSDSGTAMGKAGAPTSGATYSGSRATSSRAEKPQGLDGLDVEMPLDRIIESTTNHAKPLRALERMRRSGQHSGDDGTQLGSGSGSASTSRRGARARRPRRAQGGSTGTMDVFAVLGQINEQLGSAPDLDSFLKICVGVVQDLCRFHRVLLYQFDENYNGQVVAELVEWGKTTDLFKGLMFPAADIPAQARQLYAVNKVRLLYDRSQTTARMVLRSKEDLDTPLDMTHCYLRAMSPIHIKYLQNMNVRSSMSVSVMAFGQLWGLIACHGYGNHGMRVSFPVRQMMRLLSDSISKNIERLSYAQRLHTRKLISTIPSQHHPTGYIVSNADDLLRIFDAESGLLVIGDGCKLLGNNDQGQAMLSIAEYLRVMKFETMKASSHIARDFPDLNLPRAADTIAGLLYVPLTAKAGQDFIVFLRKGQVKEVQWAGKPYKDVQANDAASLEPRKSFKTWSETVIGRSRAWSDDQLESAGVLALIYGKFIQVWREKQSAMASNQLTAILLSNTSHAVRTPLSQIINTLELALSGDIDPDTRSMLENSHQASRALLFHVHDLLDLTKIETGNETAFNDPFDLRQAVNEAVRLYQTESSRRNLDFKVNVADSLPATVIGDARKIKTVISNLVANSVKYTQEGYIEVTIGPNNGEIHNGLVKNGHIALEFVVSDSGCGIPIEKLQRMFATLEGAEDLMDSSAAPPGLGLGLAVVARIVEQLGGQLRAESEVDVGTKFFFTVQMLEHTGANLEAISSKAESKARGSSTKSRAVTTSSGSATGSGGSVVSARSRNSEIDSFVHDFGASHMVSVGPDDKRLRDAEHRMNRPGTFPVTDSSYPVRPSKMESSSDADSNSGAASPPLPSPQIASRPTIGQRRPTNGHQSQPSSGSPQARGSPSDASPRTQTPSRRQSKDSTRRGSKDTARGSPQEGDKRQLRVLVVEDDAINSQILQKRLKMDKHITKAVPNGQEAVDVLASDWEFDAVLMDIQMPIMDGRTAAKEIRKLEAKEDHQQSEKSLRVDDRIPIFAVSASLYESDRSSLSADFDGWLLKPLDFGRVRELFKALQDPSKRNQEVYVQGQWERGGYFYAPSSRTPR